MARGWRCTQLKVWAVEIVNGWNCSGWNGVGRIVLTPNLLPRLGSTLLKLTLLIFKVFLSNENFVGGGGSQFCLTVVMSKNLRDELQFCVTVSKNLWDELQFCLTVVRNLWGESQCLENYIVWKFLDKKTEFWKCNFPFLLYRKLVLNFSRMFFRSR